MKKLTLRFDRIFSLIVVSELVGIVTCLVLSRLCNFLFWGGYYVHAKIYPAVLIIHHLDVFKSTSWPKNQCNCAPKNPSIGLLKIHPTIFLKIHPTISLKIHSTGFPKIHSSGLLKIHLAGLLKIHHASLKRFNPTGPLKIHPTVLLKIHQAPLLKIPPSWLPKMHLAPILKSTSWSKIQSSCFPTTPSWWSPKIYLAGLKFHATGLLKLHPGIFLKST